MPLHSVAIAHVFSHRAFHRLLCCLCRVKSFVALLLLRSDELKIENAKRVLWRPPHLFLYYSKLVLESTCVDEGRRVVYNFLTLSSIKITVPLNDTKFVALQFRFRKDFGAKSGENEKISFALPLPAIAFPTLKSSITLTAEPACS